MSEQLRELFKNLFEKEYAEGMAQGSAEADREYQAQLAANNEEIANLRAEIAQLKAAAMKA